MLVFKSLLSMFVDEKYPICSPVNLYPLFFNGLNKHVLFLFEHVALRCWMLLYHMSLSQDFFCYVCNRLYMYLYTYIRLIELAFHHDPLYIHLKVKIDGTDTKGRLVKRPYTPICRDCAIYFSISVYIYIYIYIYVDYRCFMFQDEGPERPGPKICTPSLPPTKQTVFFRTWK